jgi:hypothetical protein
MNNCVDCGSRVQGGHCTWCHEEVFIATQYRELGEEVPSGIAEKESEQLYDQRNFSDNK